MPSCQEERRDPETRYKSMISLSISVRFLCISSSSHSLFLFLFPHPCLSKPRWGGGGGKHSEDILRGLTSVGRPQRWRGSEWEEGQTKKQDMKVPSKERFLIEWKRIFRAFLKSEGSDWKTHLKSDHTIPLELACTRNPQQNTLECSLCPVASDEHRAY